MRRRNNTTAAIAFGFFLLFAAFPMLFWNEGRAVKTARALEEGAKKVISVPVDSVDTTNDAALVHLSGQVVTNEILSDEALGISVNAIKLRRTVEMFQWKENSGREGSSNSYEKIWSEDLIDSNTFESQGYDNPSSMPLESKTWSAEEVSLGAFWLSSNLINKLSTFETVRVADAELSNLSNTLGLASAELDGAHLFLPFAEGTLRDPEVGDLRVKLEQVLALPVSVVAQQEATTLTAFKTRSGRNLEMLRSGSLSASEMFDAAVSENNTLTWGLRFLGFIFMGFGIRFLFRPLLALTNFIPGLANLVRLGVTAVSFVLAFAFSLLTASVAWFTYRPLIAIPLITLAVIAFVGAGRFVKSKAATA